MKKILIIASILAIYSSSFAEETNVKVPVPEGFQAMEMEGMPSETAKKSNSKVTFSSSCVDVTGRTIKQGEAGYETCLNEVKFKNLNPEKSDNSASPTPGPQMNMNFNVGD